jgi:hypothetical protein
MAGGSLHMVIDEQVSPSVPFAYLISIRISGGYPSQSDRISGYPTLMSCAYPCSIILRTAMCLLCCGFAGSPHAVALRRLLRQAPADGRLPSHRALRYARVCLAVLPACEATSCLTVDLTSCVCRRLHARAAPGGAEAAHPAVRRRQGAPRPAQGLQVPPAQLLWFVCSSHFLCFCWHFWLDFDFHLDLQVPARRQLL